MKFTYPIISAIILYTVSASGDNDHAFPGAVGIVDHDDKRAQEAFHHVLDDLDKLDPEHEIHPASDEMAPDQELSFWFTSADHNGDVYLDGYELMQALTAGLTKQNGYTLEAITKHVDDILAGDDLDKDGKISFAELIESEKRLQNGKKKASSGIA